MDNKMRISNHKINGIAMDFGNGISFSTIWGIGSYSENRDIDDTWKEMSIMEIYDKHDFDTGDVELYFLNGNDELYKKLARKYKKYDINGGQHFEYLPVEKWLEIINICKKTNYLTSSRPFTEDEQQTIIKPTKVKK